MHVVFIPCPLPALSPQLVLLETSSPLHSPALGRTCTAPGTAQAPQHAVETATRTTIAEQAEKDIITRRHHSGAFYLNLVCLLADKYLGQRTEEEEPRQERYFYSRRWVRKHRARVHLLF